MKKIFVVTDNLFIYNNFNKIINVKKNILVHYYCSPTSLHIFDDEIKRGLINPLYLKKSPELFINNYDLGISCHSKQLFPAAIVNTTLCINIHPGLNPYNRGWYPQVFSIINDLPSGVTIHIMDEEIDHGDIIAQEEIEIKSCENSLDVYERIQTKEVEMIKLTIDDILNNKFKRTKPFSEGNYNSIKDYKNLCKIDMDKKVSMRYAINYLRAMTHPPYKNSYFIDEKGEKVFISIKFEKH